MMEEQSDWERAGQGDWRKSSSTGRRPAFVQPLIVPILHYGSLLSAGGGTIIMAAANPVAGVEIVVGSAFFFGLAEVIHYLAVIAHNAQAQQPFIRNIAENLQDEIDKAA
jgi:hypothetical protein